VSRGERIGNLTAPAQKGLEFPDTGLYQVYKLKSNMGHITKVKGKELPVLGLAVKGMESLSLSNTEIVGFNPTLFVYVYSVFVLSSV
jgi:hypothetical protein